MLKVVYTGNGTVPVDSGLPNVGRMFGIQEDGALRYYRYLGQGSSNPDGQHSAPDGSASWDRNSGNSIGRGWQDFLYVVGCGNGVIMGVQPNGDLRWYGYSGDGTADPTGALGWHPNSGHTIGNGWEGFTQVFSLPAQGREPQLAQIFGVDSDGELRWYGYDGDGKHDPSGHTGWHRNSGNIVGHGWNDFQYVSSADVIFAVTPDGALRWYGYSGQGASDLSGWDPNSGNQVGRGWEGMRIVAAGSSDTPRWGTVLFAVDSARRMLWYRYSGHGESDPTGALGWDPKSGNQIGKGW